MATIRKRGDKWQVQVRKNGQTASRTFMKRADATSWARETEQQAERGQLRNTQTSAPVMTLAHVLERYREEVTPTKAHPDDEAWRIGALIRSKLVGIRLDMLAATDVAKWRDQRLQCVKPGTVVRELSLLQSAIDIASNEWQQAEHLPNGNPLRTVRRPRVDDRRDRTLQPSEWQRLLDAVDEKRSPLLKPLLVLARETGMRRSVACPHWVVRFDF